MGSRRAVSRRLSPWSARSNRARDPIRGKSLHSGPHLHTASSRSPGTAARASATTARPRVAATRRARAPTRALLPNRLSTEIRSFHSIAECAVSTAGAAARALAARLEQIQKKKKKRITNYDGWRCARERGRRSNGIVLLTNKRRICSGGIGQTRTTTTWQSKCGRAGRARPQRRRVRDWLRLAILNVDRARTVRRRRHVDRLVLFGARLGRVV